eukprot:1518443-Amphidinium_carterae.3
MEPSSQKSVRFGLSPGGKDHVRAVAKSAACEVWDMGFGDTSGLAQFPKYVQGAAGVPILRVEKVATRGSSPGVRDLCHGKAPRSVLFSRILPMTPTCNIEVVEKQPKTICQ